MRRILLNLSALILGVVVATLFLRPCPRTPVEQRVVDAQLHLNNPQVIAFILSRVPKIDVKQLDGAIVTYATLSPKPRVSEFTLTSESPLRIPDHHGFSELILVSVADDKATIAYLVQTDLKSFGKNTVSILTGVATVDVEKVDSVNTEPTK